MAFGQVPVSSRRAPKYKRYNRVFKYTGRPVLPMHIPRRLTSPPAILRLTNGVPAAAAARTVAPVNPIPRNIAATPSSVRWKRSEFGQVDSTRRCHTYVYNGAITNVATKELTPVDVLAMSGRTPVGATAQLNLRSGNLIHVYGIKLYIDIQNTCETPIEAPLTIEYALVSPKNSSTVAVTEFLTNLGSEQRGQALEAAKSSMELQSERINSDENFVFVHKKLSLIHQPQNLGGASVGGHTDQNFNTKNGQSYRSVMTWVPIGRKIAWDKMTDTLSKDPLYFCIWGYKFQEVAGTNDANGFKYQLKAVTYFKNIDVN